jgi:hypothetical protein
VGASSGPHRPRLYALALLVSATTVMVASVLIVLDQARLRSEARAARAFDLRAIPLPAGLEGEAGMPTGAGNAAHQYERAFQLLHDEQGRYEALHRELAESGVATTTQIQFECLKPVIAATGMRHCGFAPHLPWRPAEAESERLRLEAMLQLGTILAARSRWEALRGEREWSAALAQRLIVMGRHLLTPPGGWPSAGRNPSTASLAARIAGLTLVRWGAHALDRLRSEAGDGERAAAYRRQAEAAAQVGDALARQRLVLAGRPAGSTSAADGAADAPSARPPAPLFTLARAALEGQDTGLRVLALTLLYDGLPARRPLFVGRSQYDAVVALGATLERGPDGDPEVAGAARARRTMRHLN